jgi:peptidoglycan DL-endopeptidase CwlO
MSSIAQKPRRLPSHRKPRSAASTRALRAGVTGGILTIAAAGAAAPANAAEPSAAESTLEIPTVSETLTGAVAQNADATAQAALGYELSAQQDQAAQRAKVAAKKAKAEAERKAKAAREAAARKAAERKAAQERAAETTTLSASATPSATGNVATLIGFLKSQLGKAYVMGATGPSAYDCSGLTQAAFRQVGISLPRVSESQSTIGTQVSLDDLQPGDILYWGSAGSAYHVAVYIGGGKFIGAQNPSSGVVEHDLSFSPPTGAVRVL